MKQKSDTMDSCFPVVDTSVPSIISPPTSLRSELLHSLTLLFWLKSSQPCIITYESVFYYILWSASCLPPLVPCGKRGLVASLRDNRPNWGWAIQGAPSRIGCWASYKGLVIETGRSYVWWYFSTRLIISKHESRATHLQISLFSSQFYICINILIYWFTIWNDIYFWRFPNICYVKRKLIRLRVFSNQDLVICIFKPLCSNGFAFSWKIIFARFCNVHGQFKFGWELGLF